MTRREVEDMLSLVINGLPRFGTTLEPEFAIHWRTQEILLCGQICWKYHVFDAEGNETVGAFDMSVNDYDSLNNCDSMVIVWTDPARTDTLDIGLRDSVNLNIDIIKNWLLAAKNIALYAADRNLANKYWEDYAKMHEWNMIALKHTRSLFKKLMEYESAAMEPDMNILSECERDIIVAMHNFKQEYSDHFGVK